MTLFSWRNKVDVNPWRKKECESYQVTEDKTNEWQRSRLATIYYRSLFLSHTREFSLLAKKQETLEANENEKALFENCQTAISSIQIDKTIEASSYRQTKKTNKQQNKTKQIKKQQKKTRPIESLQNQNLLVWECERWNYISKTRAGTSQVTPKQKEQKKKKNRNRRPKW
jgi:hypothetical protein